MQRYAFSENGERVGATEAFAQVDYQCPECQGVVRVRRGEERIPHFFHRNEGYSCRLRLKDGLHSAVQSWLIKKLGDPFCSLECHFPEISRVADIAYHPQKVIFEVQVSPITPEEAQQRTCDYWRIGWHVIWLLHTQTYGRHKASAFENSLLSIPHYFTSIGLGGGKTWDELSVVRSRRRYWYTVPPKRQVLETVTVHVFRPPPDCVVGCCSLKLPVQWWQKHRQTTWSCHLQGDWLLKDLPEERVRPQSFSCYEVWKRVKVHIHLFWLRLIGI